MSLHSCSQGSSSRDEESSDIFDEENETIIAVKKEDVTVMKPPLPVPSSIDLSKPPVRITPLVSYTRDDESGSNSDESDKEEEFDLNLLKKTAKMQEQLTSNTPIEGDSPASFGEEPEMISEELHDLRIPSDTVINQVRLPPEPEGRCSRSLQEKIAKMHERKIMGNLSLNDHVQRKKDFRNPSIYEKLVSYCNIDEYGTNYPRNLFNPSSWGMESYYDALAKAQKEAHEKKEKEKHKKGTVEFIKGTNKITVGGTAVATKVSEEKQKLSKWDSKPTESVNYPTSLSSGLPLKKLKQNP